MKLLFVGAHSDDVEILAGGTICQHSRLGDDVSVVIMTDGSKGCRGISPEETSRLRQKEQQTACSILGASLVGFGLCVDGLLMDNEATRVSLARIVCRAAPDAIVTHCECDYHPDHCACLPIVRAAVQLAFQVEEIAASNNHGGGYVRSPQIMLMDSLSGSGFSPHFFVDVTDTSETKQEALSAHTSQIRAMAAEQIDLLEMASAQARWRGEQAGVKAAEAFAFHNDWAVTRALHCLPLARPNDC